MILFETCSGLDSCISAHRTSTSHDLYLAPTLSMTSKTCGTIIEDYAVIQSGMFHLQPTESDEHIQ